MICFPKQKKHSQLALILKKTCGCSLKFYFNRVCIKTKGHNIKVENILKIFKVYGIGLCLGVKKDPMWAIR